MVLFYSMCSFFCCFMFSFLKNPSKRAICKTKSIIIQNYHVLELNNTYKIQLKNNSFLLFLLPPYLVPKEKKKTLKNARANFEEETCSDTSHFILFEKRKKQYPLKLGHFNRQFPSLIRTTYFISYLIAIGTKHELRILLQRAL